VQMTLGFLLLQILILSSRFLEFLFLSFMIVESYIYLNSVH
jgi:hypothetical protein